MASLATAGAEKNHANTQIITRSTIKSKRNTLRESTTEAKNENGTAKSRAKESSNTEVHKLRTNIEDRDHIIERLKQERDQLQKENDLLKKRLEDLGITSTDQSTKFVNTETVVGKRKHRALPQTPTPLAPSQSPLPQSPAETTTPQRLPRVDEKIPEKSQALTEDYMKFVKKAVQDGLREETYQQRERKRRANNIVIHGMKEDACTEDAVLIRKLMDAIKVKHSPKYFTRLGNTTTTTIRPLKIVMNNVEEKRTFMKALPKLKDAGVFSRLRITDDYTIKDRKTISLWLNKAKERNATEPGNSTWLIRGSPLTQLRLVKIERTNDIQAKKIATTTTTTKTKPKTR